MKKTPKRDDTSMLHAVEAATELLRRAEPTAWVWWFGGTLPFIAALLHFWTDMSRAADAWARLPTASLLLAVAYGWMKCAHSLFADSLLRHLRGEEVPTAMPLRAKLRFITSAAMIHWTTLWMLALAFFAMLPFGWVYAFYHNVTVLAPGHFRTGGRARELIRLALQQSNYRPGQNHGLMVVLLVFACLVWMNVTLGAMQMAVLLRSFTGADNAITRNPIGTLFSSTMIATTVGLSYLVVGPLVKSLYALRCFHGLSRKNGEDILVAFRRAAAPVLMIFCCANVGSARAEAAPRTEPAAASTLDATALSKNIRDVLEQDQFQWRLPRDENAKAQEGWLGGFFKTVGEWFGGVKKSTSDLFDKYLVAKIKEWLRGLEPKGHPVSSSQATPWADMAQTAMIVLLVLLLVVMLILLIKHWMKLPPAPAKAEAAEPVINLENEQIIASQLPENEWLRLAQEKIESGEYRLALRALFLATLSHLGERRLLAIAKSKSNGDYVRELALRARDRGELRGHFSANVRSFDWAWYGLHEVTRDLLDEFRSNHQHIVSDGPPR